MNPYCHLTINEREKIFLLHGQGKSLGYIANQLYRAKSAISRELKRNTVDSQAYSPSVAQHTYHLRKVNNCGRHRILNNIDLYRQVKRLFLMEQWSPEEISDYSVLLGPPVQLIGSFNIHYESTIPHIKST